MTTAEIACEVQDQMSDGADWTDACDSVKQFGFTRDEAIKAYKDEFGFHPKMWDPSDMDD